MSATRGDFFELGKRGSTFATELRGALATFLTMAYILVANPMILRAAGVPFQSAVVCTALAAGVCSIAMGLFANFPVALASGMGLNAIVAYQAAQMTGSWQTAMGLVVVDGIVIFLLVLFGLRESVMNAIPRDLRLAIGAGIGFFIAFIGAVNARIIVVPGGTLAVLSKNPAATMPPVEFGRLASPETAVAAIGFMITAFLVARRVKGAIVLGILISTAIALVWHVAVLPKEIGLNLSFEAAFKADVRGALKLHLLPLLFAFILVDFFDTLGTITGISEQAGILDSNGRIPRLRRILLVDSLSALVGGMLGASSVTSYIESAAGVAEGARTGLHSVLVGVFFLLAVFLAPVVEIVPAAATAPALILVGFLMCCQIARINFGDLSTAIPAFITFVTIPLTYSIAHGIGLGFITFVVIKILSLRFREVHPLMYAVAAVFAAFFISSAT